MRIIFTILTMLLFGFCHANDTLTRAEIYSYNVNDTFDYKISSTTSSPSTYPNSTSNVSYKRFVVTNINWGTDSTSKTIYREQVFPIHSKFDTIILDSINEYEIGLQSHLHSNEWQDSIPSSSFWGHTTNYGKYFCCSPGLQAFNYATNLGLVKSSKWGGAHGYTWSEDTTLIYYSNGTEYLGTPYTEFPTSINEQEQSIFKVYPTLATNEFWIETEETSEQSNVVIYNLQGQQILQQQLQGNKTKIDIHNLPTGMYVWKAFKGNNFMGAGKVLKEN